MKVPEKIKEKKDKIKKKEKIKPKKEHVLIVAQEIKFARLLSGNEKKTRDKVLNTLKKWLLNCFEKGYGFKTLEDTPIFIAEHLTPKGSRLHFLARDLVKSGAYKYCWTAYGKVYVKKDEQSPTINVKNEEQIHNLTLQN